MDKTFLGLLKNHVQDIENAEKGKSSNDVLLKTVKFLLDGIDDSKACLAVYDEMEMKKLFSSFGKVTQKACDFYQTSKEYLDPEALNGKIGQTLETTINEITKTNKLLESIEKNNADLFKKEKELMKKKEEYNKITEKRDTLIKIKETVSDDILKKLELESAELNKTIRQNEKIKKDLESEKKQLESAAQSISKSTVKLTADKKAIEENIIETINGKIDILKNIIEENKTDINYYKTIVDKYKKQYETLPDELNKLKEDHKLYDIYYGENSGITAKLKEYGYLTVDNFLSEINRMEGSIKTELAKCEKIIKDIIVEQEKINKEIKRRTETLN